MLGQKTKIGSNWKIGALGFSLLYLLQARPTCIHYFLVSDKMIKKQKMIAENWKDVSITRTGLFLQWREVPHG